MSTGVLHCIAKMFSHEPRWHGALGELAADPVALAEVLLLFRMVLADGVVRPSQLSAFEQICQQQFGLKAEDMEQLHMLLDSPQGQSSEAEAFSLIRQLDTDKRSALLGEMMLIARANAEFDASEEKQIRRMADLLELEPASLMRFETKKDEP
jgi:uncharacterized tellurite resistance protein B-like protein